MRMMFRAIIGCSILKQALATGLSSGLPDEAALARQQAGAGKLDKETIDAIFDEDGSLSAMWEREAKRAQLETRRFLSAQGSMPCIPTTSPIPGQTSTPSLERTLAPASEGTLAPSPLQTNIDCLEGTTLEAYLTALLSQVTPEEILLDEATPQGQALAAMLGDPFVEQNACSSDTLDQRYGLITFYYSTGGAEWSTQTSWLTDTDECTWFGVICDDIDSRATNLTLGTILQLSSPCTGRAFLTFCA